MKVFVVLLISIGLVTAVPLKQRGLAASQEDKAKILNEIRDIFKSIGKPKTQEHSAERQLSDRIANQQARQQQLTPEQLQELISSLGETAQTESFQNFLNIFNDIISIGSCGFDIAGDIIDIITNIADLIPVVQKQWKPSDDEHWTVIMLCILYTFVCLLNPRRILDMLFAYNNIGQLLLFITTVC